MPRAPKKAKRKGAPMRSSAAKRHSARKTKRPFGKKDLAPVGYQRMTVLRAPKVAFAAGASVGIRVEGIEICQVVQDLANSVSLIANKDTVVRVYLDTSSVSSPVTVRGELVWSNSRNGPMSYLASSRTVVIDPGDPKQIIDQRASLEASLNFVLPPEAVQGDHIYVNLHRLMQAGGDDLAFSGQSSVDRPLNSMPPFRVRVMGLRYTDPATGTTHSPNSLHFSYMRSYLQRAFPVAALEWSQIVINADFRPPFSRRTAILANAQLAAIRNTEINSGTDPRTHYYGLVDDANRAHFMRGRATGIPQAPEPDTVASGPCGIPQGLLGDNDASYADWYSAHELGHTCGRFHPGFPPGDQDASDPSFPYPNGQISTEDGRYFGFDFGDHRLNIPMRALPGTMKFTSTHHDVMTYADHQWLSAHTYEAIRERLIAEDELFAPLTG